MTLEATKRTGQLLMRGAIIELWRWFGCVIIIGIVIGFFTHDDTDPKGFWRHSGLRIYRDQKTGIEYLATPNGGLIPRMAPQGANIVKHMKTETVIKADDARL